MNEQDEHFEPPMNDDGDFGLNPDDASALDALVEAEWDLSALSGDTRQRAQRIVSALWPLDSYPTPEPIGDQLVNDIMARIADDRPMRLDPEPMEAQAQRWRLRSLDWRNGLAAAAAILILASIFIPMIPHSRSLDFRTACMSNLGQAGLAMGQYARANDGLMPVRYATAPEGGWLANRTNGANLFWLAKSGFASFGDLSCPGNSNIPDDATLRTMDNWPSLEATSFSYQHVIDVPAPRWETAFQLVIMADRSPLVDAAHNDESVRFDSPSKAHGSDGQNILINDGSSRWLQGAWFFKDNIWLPSTCEPSLMYQLLGDESPCNEFDAMLTN